MKIFAEKIVSCCISRSVKGMLGAIDQY